MRLSTKKIEIIQFLAQGLTDKEIAQELCISTRTVQAHIYMILKILNARNRVNAVVKFMNKYPRVDV